MDHAILGASGAHRWLNCPGSIRKSKNAPKRPGSIYAQEGTSAHSLAEECLKGKNGFKHANDFVNQSFDGHFADFAMCDAVQVYVDEIQKTINENPGSSIEIEKKFDLSWLHPGMFGTNDCSLYSPLYGKLFIFDYKHGQGISVEAENNVQLMYYALGAYHNLKEVGLTVDKIEMVIVQPRAPHKAGPIRRWEIDVDDLKDWTKKLKDGALATEKPDAPCFAGDWCRWCHASGSCTAIHDKALSVAQAEFSGKVIKLPEPGTLTDEQIGKILNFTPIIQMWLKSIHAHIQSTLETGGKFEGFKLVQGKTNRRWVDEKEVTKKFKKFDIFTDPKLKSPAQLEKIKGIGKKGIEGLWEKPEGKKTMAPSHDKRPEVPPSIETAFKHVVDTNDPLFD